MKLKSIILALFLTVGMTFSYANGTNNNVPANEAISTNYNLVEKVSASSISFTNIVYSSVEEDCKWKKFIKVTTTTHFFLGFHVGTTVTTEFIWLCV